MEPPSSSGPSPSTLSGGNPEADVAARFPGGKTGSSAAAGGQVASDGSGGLGGGPEGGSFECNICLELARDPVVTLCGHLFCWPCLYRWLQMHTACKDCPVCKAGVEEGKVIPLYGRGNSTDPRTKPVPGPEIPHRPPGQRPEPARASHAHASFGFMGMPAGPYASAQLGNFTVSAGFGLFPSLFGLQFQTIPAPTDGGGNAAGGPPHPTLAPLSPEQQQQAFLARLLLCLGFFVILCLLLF